MIYNGEVYKSNKINQGTIIYNSNILTLIFRKNK